MRRLFIIILVATYAVCPIGSPAQSIIKNNTFFQINSMNGLSQNEVYAFLEDSRGYMWIGTLDGLNIHNGNNIEKIYTSKSNPNSIPNNLIYSLCEDDKQRVWIGTANGIAVYDITTDQIKRIEIRHEGPKDIAINSIEIKDDIAFIGSNRGFFKASADCDTDSIEATMQHVTRVGHFDITAKIEPFYDNLIVMTPDYIYNFNYKEEQMEVILQRDTILNGVMHYRDFVIDKQDRLWIATHSHGVLAYNLKTKVLTNINQDTSKAIHITSNHCSQIYLNEYDDIYVATTDRGLNIIDSFSDTNGKTDCNITHFYKNNHSDFSLSSNLIQSLYISKDNTVWIGTVGNGVNIYSPNQKPFAHYKIVTNNQQNTHTNFTRAITIDSTDRLWVGTQRGLFTTNLQTGISTLHSFKDYATHKIIEIAKHKFLVATSNGVYMLQEANNGAYKHLKINTDAAIDLIRCGDNIYWAATYNGLTRIEIKNNDIATTTYNTTSTPAISTNICRALLYDKNTNELFVGTEGGGLNILKFNDDYQPTSNSVYMEGNEDDCISDNTIKVITQDHKGQIWVGTYNGLNKVTLGGTGYKFKVYSDKDGLSNNTIQLIEIDRDDILWIGTNDGLNRFNPITNNILHYQYKDGLQSDEFAEHASTQDSNGIIYTGGINGISIFDPNDIRDNIFAPRPTIVSLHIFDKLISPNQHNGDRKPILSKNISLLENITLNYKQNNISLSFSGMSFYNQSLLKYQYKLEGYDQYWVETHYPNTLAKYNKLNPGRYKFRVKATNIESGRTEYAKTLQIRVRPPLYRTMAAYIFYVVAFIVSLIEAARYSISRINAKQKMNLENEHNLKLIELDKMRSRFFVNIAHDLLTPTTLICSPLEDLISNGDIPDSIRKTLNIANNNAKKLRFLIDQMLDIRKSEFGKLKLVLQKIDLKKFLSDEIGLFKYNTAKTNIGLNFEYNMMHDYAVIDTDKVAKIIFNILSNAYKYTQNGSITITARDINDVSLEPTPLDATRGYFAIDISDTGSGIKEDQLQHIFERYYHDTSLAGNGIGLSHSKELATVHEGCIFAQSQINVGTTISLYLPNDLNATIEDSEPCSTLQYDSLLNSDYNSYNKKESTQTKTSTILIIDDNEDLREYLSEVFANKYNVIEANSADSALEMLSHNEKLPNIILCDIMMPGMGGVEFCTKLKSDPLTRHIPILLISAKNSDESIESGLKAGADDYITKPFKTSQILHKVKNHLNTQEAILNNQMAGIVITPPITLSTSNDIKFLNKLIEILEENLSNPELSIKQIEDAFYMSHATFYRKMREATGMSCKEFIQNLRIKKAYQILQSEPDIRVSDVAYMVGFTDPKYFSKCFKKQYNINPAEMHTTNQSNEETIN